MSSWYLNIVSAISSSGTNSKGNDNLVYVSVKSRYTIILANHSTKGKQAILFIVTANNQHR
mgnify:FL=1